MRHRRSRAPRIVFLRRRHNPHAGSLHRPRLYASKGRWFRSPRSPLLTHSVRINPSRRRHYRRNPGLAVIRRSFSRAWVMRAATVGMGVAAGFASLSMIRSLTARNFPMLDKWAGALNLVVGALMLGMVRNRAVKEAGLVVAGVGLYDLIATNLLPTYLPSVPRMSIPGFAASYPVSAAPVSRSAAAGVLQASYQSAMVPAGLPGGGALQGDLALTSDPYQDIFA